jgi:hypothetical protein
MPNPIDCADTRLTQVSKKPRRKTGPKTAAGKARSAQNATRHGLAGRVVVLPSEDLSVYRQFCEDFIADLHPETSVEREFAQAVADGHWRLRRVRTTEDSMFALGHDEGQGDFDANHPSIHAAYTAAKTFRDHAPAFNTLSIYEQRIQRGIEKNMKQLRELQADRKTRKSAERTRALLLHDFFTMQDLPYNPTEDGFVYSTAEIEREARLRERLWQAEQARKVNFDYTKYQKKAA